MRAVGALLLLLGEFCRLAALNPSKALTQYTISHWTQEQGLPQNTIGAIAQTADGYLWLGTDEGLARFDGYEFVVFSRDAGKLPSNSILALVAGPDGALWIGTPSGLTEYRNRMFRTFTQKEGLPGNSVSSLFVDHAGILWIVAGGNLSRFDGSRFTNYLRELDIPINVVRAVTEDTQHILYVSGTNSVAKYENGKFLELIPAAALQADFPGKILADRAGNLWILGVRGLIRRSPEGKITRYGAREGLSDSFGLNTILEDSGGSIWVGTDGGLARFEHGQFHTRVESSGEQSEVRCLLEDRERNLWMGGSPGLMRLRDDVFRVYGKEEGLPSDEPNAIFQDHLGTTWAGFLDAGLWRLSSDNARDRSAWRSPSEFAKGRVFSIRETHSGELLVATRDGLLRVKDGAFRMFVPTDPMGRKRVFDAMEDSQGRLWLALPNGLAELQGQLMRIVIPAAGPLMENSFVTLAAGLEGSLWAGAMRGGLWHLTPTERRLYTTADGLGSDQIRSLYQDPKGMLWVGTLGGGLHAFHDGKFLRFTARDGLLSDNISNILDDGEALWLSTTRGICRISKQQLRDFAAGRITRLEPLNYGAADGLRSAQSSPEIGSRASRHSDGSLWFATARGIAAYHPKWPARARLAPPTYIMDMTADDRHFDCAAHPRIPPGLGRVEIRYAAIYLSAPERVRYFYKLDGLDSEWIGAERRRTVTYNNLGRGNYRFRVRAEAPDGISNEASYEFELLPHYYESSWFRSLCAALAVMAVWMMYQLRMRQVRSRLAAVLQERLKLAREIHDTLAQAFVGISAQLDALETCLPENLRPAHIYLELARRMSQHSLTEARRSVMDLRSAALNNQNLSAALQLGARNWTQGSAVDVEVDVRGDVRTLSEEVEHNLLRIAQEAVTNALKHAGPSKITVRLVGNDHNLTLRVSDNGCGFEPEDAFVGMGGHFGLIGIRERAERIGGELRLESQPGAGTQVEVSVPLS
jgi:signal transduction histidine kinase/ligand-binding sensor domain-containing protein